MTSYLSAFEKDFIEKSEKSEARTIFWKRFGVGTLVVLLGLSGYFGVEANRAKERAEEVSEKLIQVVTDFGDMSIENHVKNDPNAFKMFSFIVEHFKKSTNKKILDVVSTSYVGMGIAYGNKKEYAEAIKNYQKGIDINSKKYEVYYNMGVIYSNTQKYSKAIESYEKAIEINPENDKAYNGLGVVYKIQNKYLKALEKFEEAIALNPKSYDAYNNLGNVYYIQHKYLEAIKEYKKAIQRNSKNDNAYNGLGISYYSLEKYNQAIKYLSKVLELNPERNIGYTNIFELQLTKDQPFNQELEEKYIRLFQREKEVFIRYEIVKILQNIVNDEEINIEQWQVKYQNIKLENWSFHELDSWISKMQEGMKKKKLMEALKIFKGHKGALKRF